MNIIKYNITNEKHHASTITVFIDRYGIVLHNYNIYIAKFRTAIIGLLHDFTRM